MKYIQSFYNYPVTFSSIPLTVPAKKADGELRNICEVTEEQLEKLKHSEPRFNQLVDIKKYRILNKLPESYKPAAYLVNEAREEAEAAKKELEELKRQMNENQESDSKDNGLESLSYQELQAKAKDLGIENVNVKKAELIAAIESAE